MAIPSACVLKITGFKKGISLGLVVNGIGAVLFVPAAMSRTFEIFLLGLFIKGTGLALLQTAANPHITILGAEILRNTSIMSSMLVNLPFSLEKYLFTSFPCLLQTTSWCHCVS